jgi:hypothetical protein
MGVAALAASSYRCRLASLTKDEKEAGCENKWLMEAEAGRACDED